MAVGGEMGGFGGGGFSIKTRDKCQKKNFSAKYECMSATHPLSTNPGNQTLIV